MLNSPKTRVAKNTAFQFGLQAAKYLFPFITIPYLTRVLGPEVYAVRAYVLAAMVFVQVFLDFGFNSYGTRCIALAGDNTKHINAETTAITVLRLILCCIGLPVVVVVSLAIPIMGANLLYVLISYAGACFKSLLPDFIFQGQEDMGIMTTRFVVSQAVATVLIIACVHVPEELIRVPMFESLAALIALVWSWANVVRTRGVRRAPLDVSLMKNAFSESGVFFVSNASTTIYSALTTLIIGFAIDDAAQISYWSIATTAVAAIQSLYTPITNSLYPYVMRERDYKLVMRLVHLGTLVVLAGAAAFAFLSDTVVLLLGGEAYLPGAYVVAMLAPVLVFSYPAMMTGLPVLAASGRSREMTISSVVAACFHIAGLLAMFVLSSISLMSVAVLRCFTELVLMLLRLRYATRVIKLAKPG